MGNVNTTRMYACNTYKEVIRKQVFERRLTRLKHNHILVLKREINVHITQKYIASKIQRNRYNAYQKCALRIWRVYIPKSKTFYILSNIKLVCFRCKIFQRSSVLCIPSECILL